MSKFNKTKPGRAIARSPITTASKAPTIRTHEHAPGYARDAKGELFLLAVSNLVGEDTFYEKAADRDARYADLVHTVAVADPAWIGGFLPWLRTAGNMRTAPMVGALEAAHAMLAHGIPGSRQIVDSVLQRADEPGEALAYWHTTFGRSVPKPVKRGVADAVRRLYTQKALLRYDTASHGFRFGDVLDLTHPVAATAEQAALFSHALDRRHNRDNPIDEVLWMVANNAALRAAVATNPAVLLDSTNLYKAAMSWEATLALGVEQGLNKKALWSALAPTMGYMALLRNLRNFDEAGVPDGVAHDVIAKLTNPGEVAESRQFPYQFLSAYEQAPSLRWAHALDVALNLSIGNIPALDGRTLVLIDTSASMTNGTVSARSKMTPARAAAVFGVALAMRCGADLYGFADGQFKHEVPKGASVIREVERFVQRTGEVGHGTRIAEAVRARFNGHDRVFIISDMQTMDSGVTNAAPSTTAMYGFNLGGYRAAAIPAGFGNRHELGGLTDATFKMVPLLEAGRTAAWPWL